MITFQAAVQSISPLTADALAALGAPQLERGFVAHRNATAIALLRALADSFPTIARILGEDAFLEVASRFVAEDAPTVLASNFYGDRFPAFLRRIGRMSRGESCASAAYVADIADIDAALIVARATADAIAVPYGDCIVPFDDLAARLVLHPSVVLLQSRFPAVSGWRANQPRGDRWVRRWEAEDAMVACTGLEAEVWRLPPGGRACVTALIAGAPLADATTAGLRASASFDLTEVTAVLTASNTVTHVVAARRQRRGLRHPGSAEMRSRHQSHSRQLSTSNWTSTPSHPTLSANARNLDQ